MAGQVRGDVGERVGRRDDPQPLAPAQLRHDVRLKRQRRHVAIGGVRVREQVLEPLPREVLVPAERLERFACGSQSTISTRRPASASIAARFAVEVVFVTPPLWLASTITNAPADRVFTDSFTSVYLYVYTSVYLPVFTSVWVERVVMVIRPPFGHEGSTGGKER